MATENYYVKIGTNPTTRPTSSMTKCKDQPKSINLDTPSVRQEMPSNNGKESQIHKAGHIASNSMNLKNTNNFNINFKSALMKKNLVKNIQSINTQLHYKDGIAQFSNIGSKSHSRLNSNDKSLTSRSNKGALKASYNSNATPSTSNSNLMSVATANTRSNRVLVPYSSVAQSDITKRNLSNSRKGSISNVKAKPNENCNPGGVQDTPPSEIKLTSQIPCNSVILKIFNKMNHSTITRKETNQNNQILISSNSSKNQLLDSSVSRQKAIKVQATNSTSNFNSTLSKPSSSGRPLNSSTTKLIKNSSTSNMFEPKPMKDGYASLKNTNNMLKNNVKRDQSAQVSRVRSKEKILEAEFNPRNKCKAISIGKHKLGPSENLDRKGSCSMRQSPKRFTSAYEHHKEKIIQIGKKFREENSQALLSMRKQEMKVHTKLQEISLEKHLEEAVVNVKENTLRKSHSNAVMNEGRSKVSQSVAAHRINIQRDQKPTPKLTQQPSKEVAVSSKSTIKIPIIKAPTLPQPLSNEALIQKNVLADNNPHYKTLCDFILTELVNNREKGAVLDESFYKDNIFRNESERVSTLIKAYHSQTSEFPKSNIFFYKLGRVSQL